MAVGPLHLKYIPNNQPPKINLIEYNQTRCKEEVETKHQNTNAPATNRKAQFTHTSKHETRIVPCHAENGLGTPPHIAI